MLMVVMLLAMKTLNVIGAFQSASLAVVFKIVSQIVGFFVQSILN